MPAAAPVWGGPVGGTPRGTTMRGGGGGGGRPGPPLRPLEPAPRLTDDLQVGLRVDQAGQPFPEEDMVVGQQNAGRSHARPASASAKGKKALTRVPCPGLESTA